MSLPIKSIPTLKGKEAEKFVKMADENYKNKHSVDFTKQSETAKKILKKSKLL